MGGIARKLQPVGLSIMKKGYDSYLITKKRQYEQITFTMYYSINY